MTGDREPPGEREPARDPGLQVERTRLAWRRSALAMTVVAILLARLALTRGGVGMAAVALIAVAWLATMALLLPWTTTTTAGRPGSRLPLSALVTAGYALLGALIIISSLG